MIISDPVVGKVDRPEVWFVAIRIYPWIGDLNLSPIEETWSLGQSGGSISKEGRVAVGLPTVLARYLLPCRPQVELMEFLITWHSYVIYNVQFLSVSLEWSEQLKALAEQSQCRKCLDFYNLIPNLL